MLGGAEAAVLFRGWLYGSDWLEPWRIYHGLGPDFRPLDDPEAPPKRPVNVRRYRHLMYGFMKAAAILREGYKDETPRAVTRRRDRPAPTPQPLPGERVTPGGVVLPRGAS